MDALARDMADLLVEIRGLRADHARWRSSSEHDGRDEQEREGLAMTAPRSLSLSGCRTKAEARSRFAAWLAEIHRDHQHQLRTDLFAARDDGEIVEDGDLEALVTVVDDAVVMARRHWEENIGATLAQFDEMLDGESLKPSDGQVD